MLTKIPHYHFVIVDSLTHALQLPYLTDPTWIEPLLSLTQNPLQEHEHLVCVAYSLIAFERLHEIISDKLVFFQTEFPHLELISDIRSVTLPLNIPAINVEINHGQIAHALLNALQDIYIKPLKINESAPPSLTEVPHPHAPSPGHTHIHPSALFFVPYK